MNTRHFLSVSLLLSLSLCALAGEKAASDIHLLAPAADAKVPAAPVVLSWRCEHAKGASCAGRYAVEVMRRHDGKCLLAVENLATNAVELTGVEPGTEYTWTVWCGKKINGARFFTEGASARNPKKPHVDGRGLPVWYAAEGVGNLRDLGGWPGLDGRKVRTGLVFRSAQFERVSEKGRDVLVRKLGVKTDLDFRTPDKLEPLKGRSPLGKEVALVNRSATAYGGFGSKDGMKEFASTFRWLLHEAKFPVAIHCAKGADRTGSWAFLLNGLLGVAEADLRYDWEITHAWNSNPLFKHRTRYNGLVDLIGKRSGATFTDKVVDFARACGITDAEIALWRDRMLEPVSAKGAGLALVAPSEGEVVPLTNAGRREFLAMDSKHRRAVFKDKAWRRVAANEVKSRPQPVVLRWSGEIPQKGFRVRVTKEGAEKPFVEACVKTNALEVWNLEIARMYRWSVSDGSREVCGAFRTADLAPRDIYVPGVPNFRDLGGWKTVDGRRVRQGMVYRSGGLNNNADYFLSTHETLDLYAKGELEARYGEDGRKMKERIDREKGQLAFDEKAPYLRKMLKRDQPRKAKERLDAAGRRLCTETLGIRTDLDLRRAEEVWRMTESPLGPSVRWVNIPSTSYGGLGKESGKKAFADVFRVFLDEANYPIDIHCIGGADRTGCACFIINALLGVAQDDLDKDWEITCYEYEDQNFGHKYRYDKFLKVLADYPGDTPRARCEAYVKELGFTDADLARLRQILLED